MSSGCQGEPLRQQRHLPPGCAAPHFTSIQCNSVCITEDGNQGCCVADEKNITINCGETNITTTVAERCVCKQGQCVDHALVKQTIKVTGLIIMFKDGGFKTYKNRIFFKVITSLSTINVMSRRGKLDFEIATSDLTLPIIFSTSYDTQWFSHISTIHILPGVTNYVHFAALTHLDEGQQLKTKRSADSGDSIYELDKNIKIYVPKNAIWTTNGGDINDLTFTLADLSKKQTLQLLPGDGYTKNNEQTQLSLMMYSFISYALPGAVINDEVALYINMTAIGANKNADGEWDAQIYHLSVRTGLWVWAQNFRVEPRRNFTIPPGATTVASFPLEPSSPYMVIGKVVDIGDTCTTAVRVQYAAGGESVKIIIYTRNSEGIFLSASSASTNVHGLACVRHPCGYRHILALGANMIGEYFPSDNHTLPTGFTFKNTKSREVTFDSFTIRGPIHRASTDTCKHSQYFFEFDEVQTMAPFIWLFPGDALFLWHENYDQILQENHKPSKGVSACMLQIHVDVSTDKPI